MSPVSATSCCCCCCSCQQPLALMLLQYSVQIFGAVGKAWQQGGEVNVGRRPCGLGCWLTLDLLRAAKPGAVILISILAVANATAHDSGGEVGRSVTVAATLMMTTGATSNRPHSSLTHSHIQSPQTRRAYFANHSASTPETPATHPAAHTPTRSKSCGNS